MKTLACWSMVGLVTIALAPVAFGAEGGGGGTNKGGGGGNQINDVGWVPYGYAVPEDSRYRFGFDDNNKKGLLGLAAKGNVILGDYTHPDFQTKVAPKLRPGLSSVTQPYVTDPTDAALGYRDSTDAKGRPVFSGNYDRVDANGTGKKLDDSPRKFYESSLPDAEFRELVDSKMLNPVYPYGQVWMNAVFYTNHAFGGLLNAYDLTINGAIVARDDALVYGTRLWLNHDLRLLNEQSREIVLPYSLKRPRLVSLQECPQSGCP